MSLSFTLPINVSSFFDSIDFNRNVFYNFLIQSLSSDEITFFKDSNFNSAQRDTEAPFYLNVQKGKTVRKFGTFNLIWKNAFGQTMLYEIYFTHSNEKIINDIIAKYGTREWRQRNGERKKEGRTRSTFLST